MGNEIMDRIGPQYNDFEFHGDWKLVLWFEDHGRQNGLAALKSDGTILEGAAEQKGQSHLCLGLL